METPEQLCKEGYRLAHSKDFGDKPPLWLSALAQADWEAEAYLLEKELEKKGIVE